GEALDFSLDLGEETTAGAEAGTEEAPDFTETVTEASPGDLGADLQGAEEEVDLDLGLEEASTAGGSGEELPDLSLEVEESAEAELGESLEELAQSLEEVGAAEEETGGLDLEIEGEVAGPEEAVEALETMQLEPEAAGTEEPEDRTVVMPRGDEIEEQSEEDEIDTKLNLAKAYIELGDNEGARTILSEVREAGTEEQVRQAEELLRQVE
ncbi:MAG: hypothetical protein D6786_09920, partial [Gammaproteobacteria bacterium]